VAERVLFPYVGDSVGGSHISSTLLIAHLDPARYEAVVVLQQEGPLADLLARMGITYQISPLPELAGEAPGFASIARAELRCLPSTLGLLRRNDITLVHTNDLRMHLTWSLPARLSGRPWIWHQRMLLSGSPLWQLLPFAAARILCISKAVQDTLPPRARAPSDVVYNPIEIDAIGNDDYRPRLLEEIKAPQDAVIVGFVGNMTAQKRPLIFVEAAALMTRRSKRSLHFVLFGDDRGGLRKQTEELVRTHGIANRVHFMGHRSPIEPWIGTLDVLLAPGVGDGFGRTLIEAMLSGTPVIASDSGGHPEIIEHRVTGFLFPPDDPNALAAAAIDLLKDRPKAMALTKFARRYAIDSFSADRHADQVMSLYERVVVGKNISV
jgi:glycosyltransferase involved in cell wall biosynthesis